jgi:cytochrome bd ubiquinol oxidase subunit I
MDPIILSRLQFAITTVYHFFFVPLTLGLGYFVAFLETIYVFNGNEMYKNMAKFWGKLFIINFAMGVVTGLVQEFQFGMNWSIFSRFVGDIIGVPLALDSLLAFFVESVFLGIWIFGWDRVSKGMHATAIWLVAIGSNISGFWILIANGFMQHPVGFLLRNGRTEMVDFTALITNPRSLLLFWHTISAGFVTASFFVLGISAYHIFSKQNAPLFKITFQLAAIIGIISTLMVGFAGHFQGEQLREVQPMAAAASEALWETANPAAFSVVTIFDSSGKGEVWSLRIPYLLSFLYFLKLSGEVEGINNIQKQYELKYGPGDYVPIVPLTFWTFRIMVGVGLLLVALAIFALYLIWKKWPEKLSRLLIGLVWVIPLPYIANSAGWILTESARQPWVVHGLLKTQAGLSPNLTTGMASLSLIGFTLTYAVLMVLDIYLLKKYAKAGLSMSDNLTLVPDKSNDIY